MQLQAGFGISLMFTRGNSDRVHAALNRSLEIAEERSDAFHMAANAGHAAVYPLARRRLSSRLAMCRAQLHDRQQA